MTGLQSPGMVLLGAEDMASLKVIVGWSLWRTDLKRHMNYHYSHFHCCFKNCIVWGLHLGKVTFKTKRLCFLVSKTRQSVHDCGQMRGSRMASAIYTK